MRTNRIRVTKRIAVGNSYTIKRAERFSVEKKEIIIVLQVNNIQDYGRTILDSRMHYLISYKCALIHQWRA